MLRKHLGVAEAQPTERKQQQQQQKVMEPVNNRISKLEITEDEKQKNHNSFNCKNSTRRNKNTER